MLPVPEGHHRMMARAVLRMLELSYQPAADRMPVLLRAHRMLVAQPVSPVRLQMLEVHRRELRMRCPRVLHRMPVALLALLVRLRMLVELRVLPVFRRKLVAQAVRLVQLRILEVYQKRLPVPVLAPDQTVAPERFRMVLLHLLAAASISLESEDPNGFRRHFEPLLALALPMVVHPILVQMVPPVVPHLDLFFLSVFLE